MITPKKIRAFFEDSLKEHVAKGIPRHLATRKARVITYNHFQFKGIKRSDIALMLHKARKEDKA